MSYYKNLTKKLKDDKFVIKLAAIAYRLSITTNSSNPYDLTPQANMKQTKRALDSVHYGINGRDLGITFAELSGL